MKEELQLIANWHFAKHDKTVNKKKKEMHYRYAMTILRAMDNLTKDPKGACGEGNG